MKRLTLVGWLLLAMTLPLMAADESSPVRTAGRFKLGLGGDMGFGRSDMIMGLYVYEGVSSSPVKKAKLSCGDAGGLNLLAGYGLSDNLDLDLGLGHKKAGLIETIEWVEADFTVDEVSLGLSLRFKPYDRLHFKLGGGPVWLVNPTLEEKVINLEDQTGYIWQVYYKDAVAMRVKGGMESFFNERYALDLGLAYQLVTYKYDKVELNGSPVWPDGTPVQPEHLGNVKDLREPDGSGLLLSLRLVRYF
ncbi:MAG: hypothetical protein BWY87_00764 [Deltaproteobacteria bacterium ADurb.Bin510]|nr:MAG: hypothetical protein BWY87_00764 [Deltaproteobacteria bacterium ADurb.Bin510]